MVNLLFICLPPLLTACLLVLAFPVFSIHLLVWIGLVPLLIGLSRQSATGGFLMAYISGVIYFAFVFEWMFAVSKYVFVHHMALFFYLSIYWGLFGLFFSFVSRRLGVIMALAMSPFLWAAMEFIRANMGFLSHAGAFLAHSQFTNHALIQIASITGVYGVSFIIVAVNAAIAAIVLLALTRWQVTEKIFESRIIPKSLVPLFGGSILLIVISLGYGHQVLSESNTEKRIRISIVQANIEQSKKWDKRYANVIMDTYKSLTLMAAKQNPTLIVWPEAATPQAITRDVGLFNEVVKIARESGSHLMLGSTSHQKYEVKSLADLKYQNSAFLIPPDPIEKDLQRYNKIHLLPFGEYVPMKNKIPWSVIKVPKIESYVPGKEYTVFEHPGFRFSTIICWESIFPQLIRHFVKNGAQFLVNITNEGWFGKGSGPHHFLVMTLFRAVENQRYVIRSANTGISCIIDHHGRILDRVRNENNEDTFVSGVLTGIVVPKNKKTFYTQYGDAFAWLSLIISSLITMWAVFKNSSTESYYS